MAATEKTVSSANGGGGAGAAAANSSNDYKERLASIKSEALRRLHAQVDNNQDGLTLYKHLQNIVRYVLDNDERDPMLTFETISRRLKEAANAPAAAAQQAPVPATATGGKKSETAIKNAASNVSAANSSNATTAAQRLADQEQTERVTERNAQINAYSKARRVLHELATEETPMEERIGQLEDEDGNCIIPNLVKQYSAFEATGLNNLPSLSEMYEINLALKKLIEQQPGLTNIKFWGKLFGLQHTYYIVETNAPEGDDEEAAAEEEAEAAEAEAAAAAAEAEQNQEEEEEEEPTEEEGEEGPTAAQLMRKKLSRLPKSKQPSKLKVPREPLGTGANRKAYFVNPDLMSSEWKKLPNISPEHIIAARRARKMLTGILDAPVISGYPSFPPNSNETHYLRAQIARISSATRISPVSYFTFDEENEDIDNPDVEQEIVENPTYRAPRLRDLLSLDGWVHHTPHILKQGRITFHDILAADADAEEENEEEEQDEDEEVDEEVRAREKQLQRIRKYDKKQRYLLRREANVPTLLQPLMEDAPISGQVAWSIQMSSRMLPLQSVITVRSSLWPGAVAISYERGRAFENLYLGLGLKHVMGNFTPAPMPNIEREYVDSAANPLLREVDDPTVADEDAIAQAKAAKLKAEEEENEEVEGDDEGEGEDDEQ